MFMSYNRPVYLFAAVLLLFVAAVSVTSAPGIEPGFGLSEGASYIIVMGTGIVCAVYAVVFVILAIAANETKEYEDWK